VKASVVKAPVLEAGHPVKHTRTIMMLSLEKVKQMKNKTLMGEFNYEYDAKPYQVHKAWPCADAADAELIVKGHAYKTGALGYRYVVEDKSYEEIVKEAASTSSEIAKEKDPAQSIPQG